jgi:adenylate cyclase
VVLEVSTIRKFLAELRKSSWTAVVVIAIAGACIGSGLQHLSSFEVLELKSLDFRFLHASHPEKADSSVVLVAIDQNSLDFYATQSVSWPWPREFYGLLVDYLKMGGAKVIAFDMDFSRSDLERLETDARESDHAFADAIGRTGNVVLGALLAFKEPGDQQGSDIDRRHLGSGYSSMLGMPTYNRAIAPLEEFQLSASRLGVINFEADRDDIARRIPLVWKFKDSYLPYFGLACYTLSRNIPIGRLDSLARTIPTGEDGKFLFYWYGRGGPSGAFKYYSIHSLIHSARKIKANLSPDVSPFEFRDKYVIVGGSAAGLFDYKPTPFTSIEPYSGMEIHATMLSNLLNRDFLVKAPEWLAYLIALVLALAISSLFSKTKNISLSLVYIIVIGAAYFVAALWLFYERMLWMRIVGPDIVIVTTFAISAVVNYATEGKQRRELRRTFNRYLSPQVVTEVLENNEQVELGGKIIEGTVYFSDIKNFTETCEMLQPKELVTLLNEYFSLATAEILKRDAMLDKYIGDAVMAIFGAPIPRTDHAPVACLTALQVQRVLHTRYGGPSRTKHSPTFETRMGLNTGNMVVGNIGSATRLDYTAIGDTVNLASRLEGVNKIFGTHIIVSESTFEQARDVIEVRELDFLRVKGKKIPIRIFELLGEKGSLSELKKEKNELFGEGLQLYRKKQFRKAWSVFKSILRFDPNDGPSHTYLNRCTVLQNHRLPRNWDGVSTLTSK